MHTKMLDGSNSIIIQQYHLHIKVFRVINSGKEINHAPSLLYLSGKEIRY